MLAAPSAHRVLFPTDRPFLEIGSHNQHGFSLTSDDDNLRWYPTGIVPDHQLWRVSLSGRQTFLEVSCPPASLSSQPYVRFPAKVGLIWAEEGVLEYGLAATPICRDAQFVYIAVQLARWDFWHGVAIGVPYGLFDGVIDLVPVRGDIPLTLRECGFLLWRTYSMN